MTQGKGKRLTTRQIDAARLIAQHGGSMTFLLFERCWKEQGFVQGASHILGKLIESGAATMALSADKLETIYTLTVDARSRTSIASYLRAPGDPPPPACADRVLSNG